MKKSKRKKIPTDKRKRKHDNPKLMGCRKSGSKREVHNNISLPQEIRKLLNKQPNFTPKVTREKRTNKTQS